MNKPTPKSPADARWETVSQTIVGVFITAVGAGVLRTSIPVAVHIHIDNLDYVDIWVATFVIIGSLLTVIGAIGTLTKGQWLLKHKTMRNIAGVIAAVGLAWIYNYIVGQLLKGIVW